MTTQPHSITVVLGIYNGATYLSGLKRQLLAQTFQDFNLIVIDNASIDNSYQLLLDWRPLFGTRLKLFKNHKNLGGGGSLYKILSDHQITTDWFVTLHQDDYYFPNHLEVLCQVIFTNSPNVVAVCSGMGSMDESGEKMPTKRRAAWLVREETSASSFLINLRFQTLSFPSSAFKTKEFSECFRYWHSPAFSDTETTLYLCAYGEFRYVNTETMLHRDNPNSESHVVNKLEANITAFISLARVFASVEFKKILGLVESDDRSYFYNELLSAIEIRVLESPLSHLLKIIATEECFRIWGNTSISAINTLAGIYQTLGSDFTSELLFGFTKDKPKNLNSELFNALVELSQVESNSIFSIISRPKSVTVRIYRYLPLTIRIYLFRLYVRIYAIKMPNHYWNAHWK